MTEMPGSLGSPRLSNRLRIVDILMRGGPRAGSTSSADRAVADDRLKLVGELQAEGLLVERRDAAADPDGEAPTVGRPPVLLSLNPAAGGGVGIDFGHDLVRVAVADLSCTLLAEDRRDFDVDGDAPGAFVLAVAMVDELLDEAELESDRVVGVGVAVSAPSCARRAARPPRGSCPAGRRARRPTSCTARLGLPVLVDNDANLGALGRVDVRARAAAPTTSST